LRSQRADLIQRYERLYARGAYMPAPERDRLAKLARRRDGGWRESFRGSRGPAREAA
jgi:hypothetical protein